jgi:hypothetical protein
MSDRGGEQAQKADEAAAALERWQAELAQRQEALAEDAGSLMRAMNGWGRVRTQQEWERLKAKAVEDYHRGGFLLERLGAERYMEPQLLVVLLMFRRGLIADLGPTTHAELMIVDATVLAYFNLLRAQRWIGDLAIRFEHEWFGLESPTAKLRKEYGRDAVEGLHVEATAERMQGQLFPLLERANRMLLRNLRALKDLRQGPAPSVQIGQAGQVNVASVQRNEANSPVAE